MECNQQNKQARKNITRDIKIKNNLTVNRGVVGEDNGEEGRGFSGTTIKDTWTKPSGGAREGAGDG